jgi:ABC-type multidrug transport system ATPase subunit
VYARTKYVLLDDPLSAVDSHTARFLYDHLFCGPLLQDRTVILVTHHVELVLPVAAYVVKMLGGRIDAHGTPAELRKRGVLEEITRTEAVELAQQQHVPAAEPTAENTGAGGTIVAEAEQAKKVHGKQPKKLVEEERREEGPVKRSIYHTYLKASSYWTWLIVLGFIILVEFLIATEKFWVRVCVL